MLSTIGSLPAAYRFFSLSPEPRQQPEAQDAEDKGAIANSPARRG